MNVNRNELLDALSLAFRAVDPPRMTAQGTIYSIHADVRYSGGRAPCLEAGDGTVGLRIPLPAGLVADDAPGMIRRAVLDVLRACAPAEEVEIDGCGRRREWHGPPEADGTQPRHPEPPAGDWPGIVIRSGAYEARLWGTTDAQGPDLGFGAEPVAELAADALRAAIKRVDASANGRGGTGDPSHLAESVTVDVDADARATLAITDGHRLYQSGPVGGGVRGTRIAIPRAVLPLLLKAVEYAGVESLEVCPLPDADGAPTADVTFRAGEVEVFAFPSRVGSRVLPPDWRTLGKIDAPGAVRVTAERRAWIDALDSAGAGLPRRMLGIDVAAGPNGCALGAVDPDVGFARVGVAGATVRGAGATCALHAYLLAAVKACEPGPVAVAWDTDTGPIRVRCEADAGGVAVVMPMRRGGASVDAARRAAA